MDDTKARWERIARWLAPLAALGLMLLAWDRIVVLNDIPTYILPRPGLVLSTLIADWSVLGSAFFATLWTTLQALALAVVGGVGLAVLFHRSRWAALAFYPYAVVLQVTPIIAIAPLIFIYVDAKTTGMLICAWIVAFFPVLSNTLLGLRSADQGLTDLFGVYGASRWQRLRYLQMPSALPYFLGGLRIAGGLALIGAVVAEFVAGAGGVGSGLAFRILEAQYRLNMPRMFAALLLIAGLGVALYGALSLVSWLALRRWHESAAPRRGRG